MTENVFVSSIVKKAFTAIKQKKLTSRITRLKQKKKKPVGYKSLCGHYTISKYFFNIIIGKSTNKPVNRFNRQFKNDKKRVEFEKY